MTLRRLLRPAARWVAARVAAAYVDAPPRTPASCEAFGGPCDGKRWTLPRTGAPIWLADPHGDHHLYVPTSPVSAAAVVRYRYAFSAATLVA